jgi:hypothetical protein
MLKKVDTNTVEVELVKRDLTSLNIDSELWREVKNMAIDKGVTATEYLEQALRVTANISQPRLDHSYDICRVL